MGTGPKTPATQVPAIHPAGDVDCEDFLEFIWGERKGWVDLPAKVGQYWVPFYMRWPSDGVLSGRIDGCIRDREDLYYSVNMFSAKGRREEDTMPGSWLWADLDEVHPTSASDLGLLPTIAVESSRGRFQSLWKLTKELPPQTLLKLNRGLTYALDADKGGYDLTQVLRLPGTRNYKYSETPFVRVLWMNERTVYDPKVVWAAVRDLVPKTELVGAVNRLRERRAIPRRAKTLLRAKPDEVVEGERSARLWELECLLAESGLSDTEIFDLVWPTPWNKWRALGTGRDRLTRDVRKAIRHVGRKKDEVKTRAIDRGSRDRTDGTVDSSGSSVVESETGATVEGEVEGSGRLPFVAYGSFVGMVMAEPRWLVKDIWTAGSHGLIAGEPKTNKTNIALALALSVASGKPFLGREEFPVGVRGPVLFVQEENGLQMMQDRLRKLTHLYGLLEGAEEIPLPKARRAGALGKQTIRVDFPPDLPLKFLNRSGFNLDLEEHCEMLEAEIEEFRPRLVVLDPMYLMVGADESSSSGMQPYLKWLLRLSDVHKCAVILIHHYRKQTFTKSGATHVRPGQRMMGSATLHGWIDSALYLSHIPQTDEEMDAGWMTVGVEREFRSQPPQRPMQIGLKLGAAGELDMEVRTGGLQGPTDRILDGITERSGVKLRELADELKMDYRTALKRCSGLSEYVTVWQSPGVATRVYLNTDPKVRRLKAAANGS
jgi:hypothetical protein